MPLCCVIGTVTAGAPVQPVQGFAVPLHETPARFLVCVQGPVTLPHPPVYVGVVQVAAGHTLNHAAAGQVSARHSAKTDNTHNRSLVFIEISLFRPQSRPTVKHD